MGYIKSSSGGGDFPVTLDGGKPTTIQSMTVGGNTVIVQLADGSSFNLMRETEIRK